MKDNCGKPLTGKEAEYLSEYIDKTSPSERTIENKKMNKELEIIRKYYGAHLSLGENLHKNPQVDRLIEMLKEYGDAKQQEIERLNNELSIGIAEMGKQNESLRIKLFQQKEEFEKDRNKFVEWATEEGFVITSSVDDDILWEKVLNTTDKRVTTNGLYSRFKKETE